MPWKETCPMEQRKAFIRSWLTRQYTMVELCDAFEIAPKTGYKWIARFKELGEAGLVEHSRARHFHPNATPRKILDLLLATRRDHPTYGPKKLVAMLQRQFL